jgi:hypothetical protein
MAQSENLALGRGELYFAEYKPGTQIPGAEKWIGNCPEFTISSDTERLDHFASTEGIRKKDFTVVLENTRSGTISTDDTKIDNVTIYSMGVATKVTTSALTGEEDLFTGVSVGGVYQLGTSDVIPEGVRKVASVVVTDGAETEPETYVLNEDYALDADSGRITILAGGAIAEGGQIEVTYNVGVYSITRMAAGATEKEGVLRFVSKNPVGPRTDYFFPWVKLGPNGDLNLIGQEDWMTIPFNVDILEKGSLAPWYATTQPVTTP